MLTEHVTVTFICWGLNEIFATSLSFCPHSSELSVSLYFCLSHHSHLYFNVCFMHIIISTDSSFLHASFSMLSPLIPPVKTLTPIPNTLCCHQMANGLSQDRCSGTIVLSLFWHPSVLRHPVHLFGMVAG